MVIKWPENILLQCILHCSTFNSNDGSGGTVNSAYIPLSFRGNTTFRANKGRSFVVRNLVTRALNEYRGLRLL